MNIHGLQSDELRLLRALRREHPHADFVFLSERKAPLSVDGAQKLIERLGVAAELPFPIHAHMLRHAAGYALAARGGGPCRPSWAIVRSLTPLFTRRWPTSGSETSGASEIGGWRLSDERDRASRLGWPGPPAHRHCGEASFGFGDFDFC